ncbi:amidohydrolase [Candidatus Halobonum tyrrellensis]|uniref:5-methylthioadenosine/S-adenosylhomocysteine deaminase n=1 Tax=Candidatus Halobonum tyrrellensis G22 TaxID=1324957 RepID=V4HJ14_9EURY|nr:amidohydrolase [Candidatus Halobonum tyrrellensis]ESP87899.1 amidohydrolase [Candidatus Halobonum tyrrellensis G22]
MTTLALTDGFVLTPGFAVEKRDVLVDADAGDIVEVGSDLGADADDTLDASDGLVIPGLVNAHSHAAMTLLRGYADDKPLDAWLREDVWPIEATLRGSDVRAGAELAMVEMIRSGVTAVGDMYFHVGDIVDVVDRSGMRARVGHGVVTVGKDDDDAQADLDESFHVAEKFDGAADGRVRTAVMPHSLTTVDEELLDEAAERSREAGIPLHFHLNETPAEVDPIVDEAGERPSAYADDRGLLRPDTWAAHGVHTDESEIHLLADRGVTVVHCPASNMKLASGMAPVQEMLDAGVNVALGTDGAASNNDLDVFGEMRDAAMVGKLAADDASAVSAESALRMATENGANALGFDSGRIEPGRNADLAVVDLDVPHLTPHHDLVSHLVYAARGSDVRHTVCDGRVLMDDRDVVAFDEGEVRERAQEAASGAVDRAER